MGSSASFMQKRDHKTAWRFLAPSLVLYGIYVIFPIFFSLYLSLTEWDGVSPSVRPLCLDSDLSCFQNFIDLWDDEVFWISFKNNIIWLVFFSLSAPLGLALALFFHVKSKFASLYKSLLFMPMVFSLVVVGTIWSWFLQPEFGLVEFILKKSSLLAENENFSMMASETWATAGLIAAAAWPHAAYCMVLYLAGLSNLQKNVIEAAQIEGVSKTQLLWHIILPMLRPATVIVVIVTMIGALRAFDLVSIMTAGGPSNSSNVLALYMYQETFLGFKYGYGAAISVVLFFISLILILLYLRQTMRDETGRS
jgi:multiple sugar transport system permease protein